MAESLRFLGTWDVQDDDIELLFISQLRNPESELDS
jgi:hypothetical protein